jgi:ABC-type dipeptide/oligopeptide/nickel transport system ATPase component
MTDTVLDVRDLVVSLGRNASATRIIDGVSLDVCQRETLCLVGESGSGKSVTSLGVMGLLQKGSLVPTGAASGLSAKSCSRRAIAACGNCAPRGWR